MTDADGATLLFMMNDNFASGQARDASRPAFRPGAYLYNYSTYGRRLLQVRRRAEHRRRAARRLLRLLLALAGGVDSSRPSRRQSTILTRRRAAPTVTYERQDGRDGDPGFNPYGLPDSNSTGLQLQHHRPAGHQSARDLELHRPRRRLGGKHPDGARWRRGHQLAHPDRPDRPGEARQSARRLHRYVSRLRADAVRPAHREKFAAVDVAQKRDRLARRGDLSVRPSAPPVSPIQRRGCQQRHRHRGLVYHDPGAADRDIGGAQFSPAPESAAGAPITVQVKTGYQFQINQVWLYYTTDGSAPEGSGGVADGNDPVHRDGLHRARQSGRREHHRLVDRARFPRFPAARCCATRSADSTPPPAASSRPARPRST